MATVIEPTALLPLENGARLTREEFERRYEAMPEVKKAELIEGVVYMGSPVSFGDHAAPEQNVATWLGLYKAYHPGVEGGNNATVRLDGDNAPQPDVILRYTDGTSARSGKFIQGPPELVVEIAASSASIDLHAKKHAYQRNGVREYLIWRVLDGELDWFALDAGEYRPLHPDARGIIESRVFPGLRLAVEALLAGDLAAVLEEQLRQ